MERGLGSGGTRWGRSGRSRRRMGGRQEEAVAPSLAGREAHTRAGVRPGERKQLPVVQFGWRSVSQIELRNWREGTGRRA